MGALRKEKKHNYIAQKLKSNKFNERADYNNELFLYLNMLFQDLEDDEYISLFSKKDKKRWSITKQDIKLLNRFVNEEDFYCSINSFYSCKAISKFTKKLRAVIVDLDYYNIDYLKDLNPESVIELMKMDVDYLEPSFYISSGRGIYIIWLLEKTYATKKSKAYWKKVEETLIDKFENFGADKKVKDLARVTRPLTSKNSKNDEVVRLILPQNENRDIYEYSLNPTRFEISDISSYFWGEKEDKQDKIIKPKKKKAKRKNKIVQLKTLSTLHYNRAIDLERIVYSRERLEGCREYLLFLYRLNLLYANVEHERALKLTLELNNAIKDSLSEDEVIRATKSAESNAEVYFRLREKYNDNMKFTLNEYLSLNGAYIYRNSTIIKELNITAEEQKELLILIDSNEKKRRKDIRNKVYYKDNKEYYQKYYQKYYEVNQDKIKKDRKNRYEMKRKADGKLSRAEQNNEIRAKIKSLLTQGFTQKEIALQLDIATRTVRNHLNYMKENELL